MSDHDSFLAEIFASPDDDGPRLVYADWLLEQGDPRVEFIHLQIQRAALEHGSSPARRLRKRELELLREHEAEWAGPVADLVDRYEFRRGFVSHIRLALSRFIRAADEIFQHAPVDSLRLRKGASNTRKLFEISHLKKVRSLNLHRSRLDGPSVRALRDCGHFESLRHAEFDQCGLTPEGCHILAGTNLPSLESLDLSGNTHLSGSDGGVTLFSKLTELKKLNFNFCYVGNASAAALARNTMPHLTELGLRCCNLTQQGIATLASATGLPSLRVLDLGSNHGAHELVAASFPNLEELDISHQRITDTQLAALIESPSFQNLRRLNLNSIHGLTSRGIETLAQSPFLGQLESLSVQFPGMRKDDVLALAESPHIRRPGILNIGGYALSHEDRAFLADRYGKRLGNLDF